MSKNCRKIFFLSKNFQPKMHKLRLKTLNWGKSWGLRTHNLICWKLATVCMSEFCPTFAVSVETHRRQRSSHIIWTCLLAKQERNPFNKSHVKGKQKNKKNSLLTDHWRCYARLKCTRGPLCKAYEVTTLPYSAARKSISSSISDTFGVSFSTFVAPLETHLRTIQVS